MKNLFAWVTTLTTCPTLSRDQYLVLDPKLQALYDQALALSRADGIVDQTVIAALYKEAAEKGHWPSMHNLAVHYYEGNGIEESDEKALYWWRQIEALDIPDGYTHMARVYRMGIGVKPDEHKALEYMGKAARLGDPDAQFMVGRYLFSPLKRFDDSKKISNYSAKNRIKCLTRFYRNFFHSSDGDTPVIIVIPVRHKRPAKGFIYVR